MPEDRSNPIEVIEFHCRQCGALTAVNRARSDRVPAWCLQCWTEVDRNLVARASRNLVWRDDKDRALGWLESSLRTAIGRARLQWYAGYISDCSSVFDEASAVTLSRDTTVITLREHGGSVSRFTRSDAPDGEGCIVFNEVPQETQAPFDPPPPSSPRLALRETFDYSVRIQRDGHDSHCTRRSGASNHLQLVGTSPQFRLESIGMVPGGGVVSRFCGDIVRPAVSRTRVTLSAVDGDDAHVSSASFDLDSGLVDALRAGDEVNVTRTPRGSLALSVLRDGGLLVALGAVSAVPLGPLLRVVVRRDRLSKDPPLEGATDAEYPWLHPLEITSGEPPRRPGGYTIRVWYRAWPPPDDADECVTIFRTGACPDSAAFASTHLMAMDDGLRLTAW